MLLNVVGAIQLIPRLRVMKDPLLLMLPMFAAMGIAVFSGLVSVGFGSRINLAHKHAATTIWSRNREKLIVAAIGAAIGALITKVVDWLMAAHP